jgi:hypothetical protein
MLLMWRSSINIYLAKFGYIENMKVENPKHLFILWAILAIFGDFVNEKKLFLVVFCFSKAREFVME